MATPGPRPAGTFSADVTSSGGYDRFRSRWEEQVGVAYPAPPFTLGDTGDFRISARAVQVHD
jgi:AraC family transcriptional activator of tynA and feaB